MPLDPDFTDSDQAWFDRLSGASQGRPPASPAERQVDMLRDAFEREGEAIDATPELAALTTPEAQARRLEDVRSRLRAEGELLARRPWWHWAPLPAAALAAALVVTVVVVKQPASDSPTYGDFPGTLGALHTITLPHAEPRRAAEALARALTDAGVATQVRQRGKDYGVAIVVAPDTPPAALDALHAVGAAPLPGANRVVFKPR